MARLKVIIADDHILFQQGLELLLKNETSLDFEILGCADTGNALLELLKTQQPDIIFMDLNMPNMDGLEALQNIKKNQIASKIIILTMYEDPKVVSKILKTEIVDGYVLKKYGKAEIIKAINKILEGKVYYSKGIASHPKQVRPTANGSKYDDKYVRTYRLTRRELQVLKLISDAFSNKQIAKQLFISDQTVSVHRKNIMKKLNVNNTAGLIKVAYDFSLLD